MKSMTSLTMDNYLFSGETIDEVCVLTFKEMPLLHVMNLEAKETLLHYLERIADNKDINVLLIKGASEKMDRATYIGYYQKMINSDVNMLPLARMYNAVNQFILQLADLNKMVIHADSGNTILLHMNVSLACDYRIVADNTIYQNPNIELGVVPKGGSVYFLSKMLGTAATAKLLLSGEDFTAAQAHQLGIVDKVVPLKDLGRIALETAQSYAKLPLGYAIGIKKLLSFDLKELENYLEFESELLQRLIQLGQLHSSSSLDTNL